MKNFIGSDLFLALERIKDNEIGADKFNKIVEVFTAGISFIISNTKLSNALTEIKSILQKISNAEALYLHLDEAYVRLFISAREGVTTPLYASCYANLTSGEKALLMGEPAIDMKNRFESKSLSLSNEIHEPPDHISIELEYLYFLLDKGWSDDDQELIREASAFAADAMLPWVSKLQTRLAAEKKCRFYPLMASMLKAILQIIAGFNRNFGKR